MYNIVGPTTLLTHDNNVIQTSFRQQPYNINLWDFYVGVYQKVIRLRFPFYRGLGICRTLYYTLIGTTSASLFSISICKNFTAYMWTRFVRHRLAVSLWTNCKPTAIISSSFYKLVVVNLVAICYVQAISDLLRQLIVTKSNEVVDLVIYTRCDNLFQICQTTGNKQWECIPISSRRTDMLQTCSPE